MRIGMMADTYKPYLSGVTNYIELSKKFLEQAGHDVFVFTFGDDRVEDDEVNIIRSPGFPVLEEGVYVSVRYSRDIQKLLHTMDVLHVHHPFISGQLAIRYTKGRGIPIIFTNHTRYDLYAKTYLPVVPIEISETFLKAYLPSFCRSIDRVIAPSPGLRDVLVRMGVDAEIHVVPNGVDMSRVQDNPDPIERSRLGLSEEDVVLIFLGRLAQEKNLIFLLRAFAGVAESIDRVKLVLVGEGPDRDNLVDRVRHMKLEDRVIFTGRVAYEDVPAYLHMSDAFVTASVTEVHPLSVIEAMGAGLPVLGIVSPGVGDTIEDGVTGFLANHEDLPAFTAKMVILVSDDERRNAMGVQAKKTSALYDIRRTTKLMEEQYIYVAQNKVPEKRSLRARLLRTFDRWTG
ncbi:MAG: glycosyltransferase [Anaerolineales bacterium]